MVSYDMTKTPVVNVVDDKPADCHRNNYGKKDYNDNLFRNF